VVFATTMPPAIADKGPNKIGAVRLFLKFIRLSYNRGPPRGDAGAAPSTVPGASSNTGPCFFVQSVALEAATALLTSSSPPSFFSGVLSFIFSTVLDRSATTCPSGVDNGLGVPIFRGAIIGEIVQIIRGRSCI